MHIQIVEDKKEFGLDAQEGAGGGEPFGGDCAAHTGTEPSMILRSDDNGEVWCKLQTVLTCPRRRNGTRRVCAFGISCRKLYPVAAWHCVQHRCDMHQWHSIRQPLVVPSNDLACRREQNSSLRARQYSYGSLRDRPYPTYLLRYGASLSSGLP